MRRDFTLRKRLILGFVILLVLADATLAVYSWDLASAPRTPEQQFATVAKQLDLLNQSIDNGQAIRNNIPAIQKDCDKFEHSLFPARSGYSTVSSELDGIAKKAGIRLADLSYKPTAIPERKLMEVAIDATVNGDYKNVIQFLNGVQRSASLYEVDSLTLANENTNQGPANNIKVAVHLRTYFWTGS
jgi:type IV pilus assembly protein PilO